MNSAPEHDWQPDPQLLAAYFDGELAGRADVRARIENWLAAHPEAVQDWDEWKKLLRDTAPPEPSEATWQLVRDRIDAARPAPQRRSRRPWLAAAVIAASVVLVIGVLFGAWRSLQTPDDALVESAATESARRRRFRSVPGRLGQRDYNLAASKAPTWTASSSALFR